MSTDLSHAAAPSASDRAKIEIRSASKVFAARSVLVAALSECSFEVSDGEFVSLLGPSGCGKSTLLRVLGGLDELSAGSVEIDDAKDGRPLTGTVFQEQGVFPWMNVLDNVAFALRCRNVGAAERRERATQMLRKIRLENFADALPHQLSGGMRQRVGIGRAFVSAPQILLMDEPFAALDEQTKLVLQQELLTLWDETRQTVIYVTHSIDEAIVLSDRVVVMTSRPGRIKLDVEVPFPRPRDIYELRRTPEYGDLWARIWTSLRDELSTDGQVVPDQQG